MPLDPFTGTIVAMALMFVAGATSIVGSIGMGLGLSEPPFDTPEGQRQFLRDIGAGSVADHIPG